MNTSYARLLAVLLSLAAAHLVYASASQSAKASDPLRVHPANPRYFTDGTKNADGSLKAVYLTGSHTWNNLVDMDKADPPAPFDFEAYLEFLQRYDHGGEVTVDLSAASSSLAVEWLNPRSGDIAQGQSTPGGRKRSFKPPFDGDAVLYLRGQP